MSLYWLRTLLLVIVTVTGVAPRPLGIAAATDDRLWHHRNLGKAFYENPTTQYEAVEEFHKALELAPGSARERLNYGLALIRAGKIDDGTAELEKVQRQDPTLPHTWFNLGIQYKKRGTAEGNARAIAQLERMLALVPDEPMSHYNLGYLYKITGRQQDAIRHFEAASGLDPNLAGPHFQLYNAYRDPQSGRQEEAARELARFQAIKKQQAGAVIPEDLEWSYYSEIFDPTDSSAGDADPAPSVPTFREREVLRGVDAGSAGLVLLLGDADDRPNLLVWSLHGVSFLAGGVEQIRTTGVEELRAVVSVSPGDFDNDGRTDLAVLTADHATLWRNTGGRFAASAAAVQAGRFRRALWLDYDRDYDLDLLLLGSRSYLLQNAGAAGFVDATREFPFVEGTPTDAVRFEAVADTIGHDIVVSYADRSGVLYRDRLAGKYEATSVDALPAGSSSLVALDFNRDSWIDLAAAAPASTIVLVNTAGRLEGAFAVPRRAQTLAVADFDNHGAADLLAGKQLLRWTPAGLVAVDVPGRDAVAQALADFDGDGRLDLASLDAQGVLRIATPAAESGSRWLRVSLEGVKNVKSAIGAEVEVKAGSRYQKALYGGVPILFGLGERDSVDTVRITWPNGLIQNETRQPVRRTGSFKEAPRLSGSCPMIFTWDGSKFRFITDVLGVAPLGASAGDSSYFPVDHDEYVFVAGEALAPIDGRYDIRVTEELREVSYLDRIQLIGLDHPVSTTVVINDKFKAPPFPEFRLFGVEQPVAPTAARDHRNADVLDRLLAVDRRYPDAFRRNYEGVAELHHLDLDFGRAAPDNRSVLVLTGWVDWADGSTFRGAAQQDPRGLVLPFLQVKDADGRWQTVIDHMGLPAGKPKTIAIDLTGKFLSDAREIRIVTNLCVYWDRIYLSENTRAPDVVLSPLDLLSADLRFHGFSRPVIDRERRQPEAFDYQDVRPTSMWNPTPGLYTRYGDVGTLLTAPDDRLVLMASGDEVRLTFDARQLPPLRAGWKRDFLLLFEGWAKDGDPNTAFSQTVEPLPFRAMSAYPYGESERFPNAEYAREYNTRPALRIIRPLRDPRPWR